MKKHIFLFLVVFAGLGIAWYIWQQHSGRLPFQSQASGQSDRTMLTPRGGKSSPVQAANSTKSAPLRSPGTPSEDSKSDSLYLGKIASIFGKPFVFHGLVLDERDKPISEAKVHFSFNDSPMPNGIGTNGETVSDSYGRFVIRGRGMGLFVEVSKNGYYRVPTLPGKRGSSSVFRNHEHLGDTDIPISTESEPAIFILRKMGESASLHHIAPKVIVVPKDGVPTLIDLGSGCRVFSNVHNIQVEVFTWDQGWNSNKGGHYDWKCRISVPGGGVRERAGLFDFEAPEAGYYATYEVSMSRTDVRWSNGFQKTFFARFTDGRFARFSLSLTTSGDHFIMLESFINPEIGNRNLEFDPP
jgi:hypothetical protein